MALQVLSFTPVIMLGLAAVPTEFSPSNANRCNHTQEQQYPAVLYADLGHLVRPRLCKGVSCESYGQPGPVGWSIERN